jgi:hypothetical protein
MIVPLDGTNLLEVDVYLNQEGGISFEPFYKNQESDGSFETDLMELVEEFIAFQRHGETGRIENPQVDAAFALLDSLQACVRKLEEAIYD